MGGTQIHSPLFCSQADLQLAVSLRFHFVSFVVLGERSELRLSQREQSLAVLGEAELEASRKR